jgi:chromosome segregation ATPase
MSSWAPELVRSLNAQRRTARVAATALATAHGERDAARDDGAAADARARAAEDDVAVATDALETLEQHRQRAETECFQLRSALRVSERTADVANERAQNATANERRAQSECTALRQQEGALQAVLATLHADHAAQVEEVNDLTEYGEAAMESVRSLQRQTALLSREVAKQEDIIDTERRGKIMAEDENVRAAKAAGNREQELRRALQRAADDNGTAVAQIHDMQTQLDEALQAKQETEKRLRILDAVLQEQAARELDADGGMRS